MSGWTTACSRYFHQHRISCTPTPTQSHNITIFKQIEDYPSGYPRFTRLIGSDRAFNLSRRFSAVRSRLILYKQDHISVLEKQLDELDQNEERLLFLGSLRRDTNPKRREVMQKLDSALADYDNLLERNVRIQQLPAASKRNTLNLLRWVEGTGSICRKECSFLYEQDLCASGKGGENGLAAIECFVEWIFVWVVKCFRRVPNSSVSRDRHIYVFTGSALRSFTHLTITCLIVGLLLLPIIMMYTIQSLPLQIFVMAIAAGLYILVLSSMANAKAANIFIAGPTYVAILTIFLASKG